MKRLFKLYALLLAFAAVLLFSCKKDSEEGPTEPEPVKVSGVSLDKSSLVLKEGETFRLTATVDPSEASIKTVSWSSSNAAVAVVDENGLVTAKGLGTATITVTTTDGGKTAECAVEVRMDIACSIIDLPSVNEGKISPSLIVNGNEHYVILGGHTNGFSLAGTVEEYKNGAWTTINTGIKHDLGFQVTLADGRTLLGGGCSSGYGSGQSSSVHIYDPADASVSQTGDMACGRTMCRAVLLHGGKVLVGGSWYNNAGKCIEVYDPKTGSFAEVPQRLGHSYSSPLIMPTKDGGAIILGGQSAYGDIYDADGTFYKYSADNTLATKTDDVLKDNLVDMSFSSSSNMVESHKTPDGHYVILAKSNKKGGYCLLDFDPENESFSILGELPDAGGPYSNEIMVNTKKSLVYVFSFDSEWKPTLNLFSLSEKKVVESVPVSKNIVSAGIRMLPDGNVLVVGGSADGSNFNALSQAFIIKLFD